MPYKLANYFYLPRCAYDDVTPDGEPKWFKKYKFMCSGSWLWSAVRSCTCAIPHKPLMDEVVLEDGTVQRNGRMVDMEASGLYPLALGRALVAAWADSSQKSCARSDAAAKKGLQASSPVVQDVCSSVSNNSPVVQDVCDDPWSHTLHTRSASVSDEIADDPWGQGLFAEPPLSKASAKVNKRLPRSRKLPSLKKSRAAERPAADNTVDLDPWS